MQSHFSALRAIDLRVLYLILWLSGTSFIAMSCFLAALSSSASMSTAIYYAQFLIALVTVASCSSPYDEYTSVGYDDGSVDQSTCYYMTSSWNSIYSSKLTGNTFVQFLVFFLPYFHAAAAMGDVLSVVQYEGQSVHMSDLANSVDLYYKVSSNYYDFTSPWLSRSLTVLGCNTIV
jgi:hypothetical protein